MQAQVDFDTVRRKLSDSTIGFLREIEPESRFDSAGTGTLVRIGNVAGILTAAHVLSKLPITGKIAVVRFPSVRIEIQRFFLDMEHTDRFLIGDGSGPEKPDLAFLRLSSPAIAEFEARNVFQNLTKRKESILKFDKPQDYYFNFISGVVHEWTEEVPPQFPYTKLLMFNARATEGTIISEKEIEGFDFLHVKLIDANGVPHPTSYAGTSGGGLWRITLVGSENSPPEVEARLVGVAFRQQLEPANGTIICHGPKSVYDILHDRILERWPD